MINHKRKYIFIRIPKTASQSVQKTLNKKDKQTHIRLCQIKKEYHKYFKFTFVRNPLDRIVSAFFFLRNDGLNKQDKIWANQHINKYSDFNTFVRSWINKNNIWSHHHFRPQYFYITNNKYSLPPIDFIGYFEA